MSIAEAQIINKVLKDKDYSIIEDNFLEKENFSQFCDEFLFIKRFYEKYKAVPDKETFTSKFCNFEYFSVSQPIESIVDEILEQTVFRKAVVLLNQGADIFEQDANKGVEFLLEHLDELQIGNGFRCTDIVHDDSRLKEWIAKRDNKHGSYIEIPLKEIQKDLFGFQRGEELFLWLAKSSVGKSQILSMCVESASRQGFRVGLISPEMSKEAMGYRFDTARTHMSNTAMQNGLLLPKYEEYFEKLLLSDEHVFVADSSDFGGNITLQHCSNFIKSKKLDILFIDGIVYIQPTNNVRGRTASEMMGSSCRGLLSMSTEFSIPVVGVVQARRRNGEKRTEDETLSDGESVYNSYEVTQTATRIVSINKVASALKFLVAKNRYGIDGKEYIYNYDYDKLLLTYIPSVDDLKNNKEIFEEASEAREKFKRIF